MPRSERPLDPGDTPLLRFAAELRRLRESAGSPVYRDLSVKAHYSVAVLSEAASGRKLPTLAVTLAYVEACGGDAKEWESRWREVADAQEEPAAEDRGVAPYLGLSAFQVEDAGRFHGRGALLAHLSNHILNRRLVVVFGASGAGKSSLLRAGLAATSLREGVDGLGPQRTVLFTPGAHPIEECALWLAELTGGSATELRSELRADPTALHLWLRQALVDHAREALIVVDQFEEVFTLCADEDERLAFITALIHLATAATSVVRLVLGVRADFFGHCLQYPQLRQVLGEGPVLVGAMTADELRLAITKPAIDLGYAVETALVTRLVSEATNQPGVLPLMSHALLETWRRRQGMTLTAAGYDAAGGISHALGRTAESVYSGLTADQQSVARQVFLRLTALGDGTEDTRRHVSRAELDHVDNLDEVLTALVDARLITVDQDGVDIAHEALISHWPRLREWLTEDREGLRAQRQLTEAAEIWDSLNRDDGALYRGSRLELTREWVKASTPSLSHREQAFFSRSIEVCRLEALAAKTRTRRLKQLVAVLVVLSVALAGTTAYSLISQQTVASQRDQATIQNLISQIPTIALGNPELAGELAVAAYRLDPTPRTRGLVLASNANTRASRAQPEDSLGTVNADQVLDSDSALYAHIDGFSVQVTKTSEVGPDQVALPVPPKIDLARVAEDVALSPDGRRLAVVLAGVKEHNVVELWDITNRMQPKLARSYPTDTDVVVAFTSDSKVLAISSRGWAVEGSDKTDLATRLWDVTDLTADHPIAVLPDAINAIELAADGSTLITAPISERLRKGEPEPKDSPGVTGPWKIWDLKAALSGKPAPPIDMTAIGADDRLAVSPDSRLIADLHRADTGSTLALFRRDPGGALVKVSEVSPGLSSGGPAFSPDGKRVAVIASDNAVALWDVADPAAPTEFATIPGRTNAARLLSFAADGRLSVVESGDVLTHGLDVDKAVAKICDAAKKPQVSRDKWPAWNTFFPSMDVPEPCPR
jgi:hypothetical protein